MSERVYFVAKKLTEKDIDKIVEIHKENPSPLDRIASIFPITRKYTVTRYKFNKFVEIEGDKEWKKAVYKKIQ